MVQQKRDKSFQISTFRSALLHRGMMVLVETETGDALIVVGDDCVQGMEKLVSSPSIRRNLVSSLYVVTVTTSL